MKFLRSKRSPLVVSKDSVSDRDPPQLTMLDAAVPRRNRAPLSKNRTETGVGFFREEHLDWERGLPRQQARVCRGDGSLNSGQIASHLYWRRRVETRETTPDLIEIVFIGMELEGKG